MTSTALSRRALLALAAPLVLCAAPAFASGKEKKKEGGEGSAPSIGMGVRDDCHGQGIGSKLLEALLDAADNWLNIRRVELSVFADNAAAIALYRKFGFEEEGVLRDYAFRDGHFADVLTMARLRRG